MFGNQEVSPIKSDAVAVTKHGAAELREPHNKCLFEDCDLSSPANRSTPNERVAALGSSGEGPSIANAVTPPETKNDAQSDVKDQLGTENEFMTYAPNLYRHQLGLPGNASSKEFVDKYIGKQVDNFEHENKQLQNMTLRISDVDDKTSKDILEHKPGSEQKLADILLKKEKEFLEIPAELKGEESYKKIETGILHDNYRAQVDLEKLTRAMQSP